MFIYQTHNVLQGDGPEAELQVVPFPNEEGPTEAPVSWPLVVVPLRRAALQLPKR